MAIFPGAIATDANLYIAVDNLSTLLTDNPLTIGATTVNVADASLFPTVGFISIDAEIIFYTGKTATSFTGCTRGSLGTIAATHALNAQVDHNVVSAHHNAPKDEIIAIETHIDTVIGRDTLKLKAPDGTAAAPAYTFAADQSVGLYRESANALGFSSAGSLRARLFGDQFEMSDGSATSPAWTFRQDVNTGMYRVGADIVGFATAGILRWQITDDGTLAVLGGSAHRLLNSAGTATAPSYSFNVSGSTSTGMYSSIVGNLEFAASGSRMFYLSPGIFSVDNGVQVQIPDGLVSAPSQSFSNDPDSGMYRIGANNIAIGTGGIRAIEITSAQAVRIKGTATNDSAVAGDVGEYYESAVGSASAPATGTYDDKTSISIPAGDWLVFGCLYVDSGAATVTSAVVGLSTTSGNSGAGLIVAKNAGYQGGLASARAETLTAGPHRVSLASTTTYYLKQRVDYAGGTPNTQGFMYAIRSR